MRALDREGAQAGKRTREAVEQLRVHRVCREDEFFQRRAALLRFEHVEESHYALRAEFRVCDDQFREAGRHAGEVGEEAKISVLRLIPWGAGAPHLAQANIQSPEFGQHELCEGA